MSKGYDTVLREYRESAPKAGPKDTIFWKPCAFNRLGVSQATCRSTTRVLQRNRSGCCATDCASGERVCVACLTLGEAEPGLVDNPETGLCSWHTEKGVEARRPRHAEGTNVEIPRRLAPRVIQPEPGKPGPKRAAPAPPAKLKKLNSEKTKSAERWREVLHRVRKAMGNATHVVVNPADCRPMEGQPRQWFDEGALAELSNSIREAGQFQDALVRAAKSGDTRKYEILDGERRWRAILLGGILTYQAKLVEIDDEAAPFVIACIANFNRAGHTVMELSDSIARLRHDLDMPLAAIAEQYNISVLWAQELAGLQNLHPQIRNQLDPRLKKTERLPVTAAIQVSKLEPVVQEELVGKFKRREVTLKGLRREALAIAERTGTFIRQREANQPARKLKSVVRLSGATLHNLTDLKMALAEEGMNDILRVNGRQAAEASVSLRKAETVLKECRELLKMR